MSAIQTIFHCAFRCAISCTCAFASCQSPDTIAQPGQQVSPLAASESGNPLYAFEPNVGLDDVRFAFLHRGRVFFELSDDYEGVYAGLERIPGFLDRLPQLEPFTPSLTAEETRYVLKRIPESIGDPYALYFPHSRKIMRGELGGVAPRFTGLGTYHGLIGVMEIASGSLPDEEEVAIALRFNIADRIKLVSGSRENVETSAVKSATAQLHKHLDNRDFEIVQAFQLAIDSTECTIILLIRLANGDVNLYCTRRDNTSWKVVPLCTASCQQVSQLFIDETGTGLVFEHGMPESDNSMMETGLVVLPDFDGDGNCEFLITSRSFFGLLSVSKGAPTADGAAQFTFLEIRSIGFV